MTGFVAILCVDLLHDTVDVIFHGEFGKIEVRGDFFVAQAHGDQGHELALALGQFEAHASALFGDGGLLIGLAGQSLEQDLAEFCGTDGFALGNAADGVNEFRGRGAFEHVAVHS